MLPRFLVPQVDQIRVSEAALRECVAAIFVSCGVAERAAIDGADVLVTADLRGVETHGVSNMMRAYVEWFGANLLNPAPNVSVIRDAPSTRSIDGDRGLGILLGTDAMAVAIEKAKATGAGIVTMKNAGHLGAVGHFAMQAAREGMVGMCMTSISMNVLPTWAAEPRLGTNPISIAAPTRNEPMFVFDAATSTIAGNKIGLARRVGANVEPGWISEPDGTPIMEERPVPEGDGYKLGGYGLLPLGGTREQGSHKGYGLNLMVEVLTTLLSGGIPNMLQDIYPLARHHFAAYDIESFCDREQFLSTMDGMLETLRTTPPSPGHDRVLYPGLPEHETELDRRVNGIPLHREVIEWFNQCTDGCGLARLGTI